MASTSESPPLTDEVDLIDLETGITPQPRITIADATPEEQEHLLDVCPPKLEQKLSLTRRSHDHLRNSEERDNVLVTLGHDQVVPIRKRIDVVSTDTIKRVRDITKNLEPVIQSVDSVDNFVGDRDDDASRQINDAFDFLAELDDNEEEQHRILDEPKSYPLEPTCYIQEKSNSFVFDNAAFEASPPGKVNEKRPGSMNFDFDGLKAARNSFKRLRSLTCSAVGLDSEQPWRKRSKNCPYRKSWSAGSRRSRCDLVGKRKRRNSERMDKGVKRDRLKKSASSVGQSSNSSSASSSSSSSSSSASSSCSEVDWSWVEEAAAAAAGSASTAATTTAATSGEEAVAARLTPTSRRVRSPRGGGGSGESSVSAAAEVGCSSSVAMSVAAAAAKSSSEPIVVVDSLLVQCNDQCIVPNLRDNDTSRIVNSVESNSGGTLPWLRASMRRLRQLRILESSNNTTTQDPCSSLPDIALIAPEILAAQTNDTTGNLLRPSSAPAPVRSAPAPPNSPNAATVTTATRTNATTVSTTTNTTNNTPRRGGRRSRCQQRQTSEAASAARSASSAESTSTYASSNGGASSSVSSSTMSSATVSPVHQPNGTSSPRRLCERQRDGDRDDERGEDEDEDENPLGKWPHALSPALACLGCTLGLFNISRFAILSIQFGANFIVQFLILSLVIGIPLLTLQVCLGQRLSAGAVDMWKISPLFQGVGIALLTAHAFIGIYSIVGVSWIFVYFRDSFVTKLDRYRWAEPFLLYREDFKPTISSTSYSIGYGSVYGSNNGNGNGNNNNNNNNNNGTYKLHETVPDYFSGAVLQRHHLNEPDPGVVTLKFQVAFNLAVVWMIVFVSLSKGLRSYGKVVYVFTLVPIFGTLVLCTKLLGLTPPGSINQLFPATVWAEFFINGRSWVAAASEVFLTWGLLGAAAMQIAAHNKHKHLLQRDTSLVIVLTLVVLLLAAFLANTCVQILKYHGYVYTTSSFERMTTYGFMRPYNQPAPSGYASTPERFMTHASFVVGQRVTRPGLGVEQQSTESGYQALRLATELVPATLAVLGTEQVSPFWAVLFYFILILFGIAQQLAIWHCVITGIMAINTKMMKLWETTITFFSCACAYILGLPMATEMGIYVVYYLDYTVGGGWWIIVLYLVQVGAVFAVRGRPHTGEAVVAELFPPTGRCLKYWAAPLLSFTWNVVLPITLMVLSISIFKNAGYRELYTYRRTKSDYWSVWARQLGGSIQLIPILMIPVVAIIQTCRYLNSGPPDIFDRIQLLYRPSLDLDDPQNGQTHLNGANGTSGHHNGANGLVSSTTELPFEDPPPKYTPPPSYTTATGARIAKMLRQSFRRSVRRIANVLGEGGSAAVTRSRPPLQQQPPPPDYATVLVEMNQSVSSRDVAIHIAEVRPDVANTRRQQRADRYARPNTIDRSICRGISTIDTCRGHYTVDRNAGRRPQTASNGTSNLTAAEVANLLRSSIRRVPQRQRTEAQLQQQQSPQQQQQQQIAASVENLVEAAAPIGHETAPNKQQQPPLVEQPNKTKDEMDSSVSVI